MKRALALYSGGLDSTLAIALMQRAGVEVIPITFVTPFTSPFSKTGQLDKSAMIAQAFGLELKKLPLLDELLAVIKKPRFGHGKNINPCIDCHLLMLQHAKARLAEFQADFVVTGEVLGQRPMSQHKQALELIARKSGLEGLLVRPLCAKLLAPTIPQERGWVAPEYLLDIRGRGRKRQFALAREMGLNQFSPPAGGCLLTDGGYSRKLKVLLAADMLTVENCYWVQYGRFFDVADKTKLVVARNEQECQALQNHARSGDMLVWPLEGHGPTALLRGQNPDASLDLALGIVAHYCRSQARPILVVESSAGHKLLEKSAAPRPEAEISRLLVG